jgi:hypothetical protein
LRRRKASAPAADLANEGRVSEHAGEQLRSQAKSSEAAFQAMAVYDGQRCIGFLRPRGKSGFAAFNANDRALGTFATVKAAADAVSKAVS